MTTASFRAVAVGDPAPWFQAKLLNGADDFRFDRCGGRYVLLLLFGSACQQPCTEALRLVRDNAGMFDDETISFFGVTSDPDDLASGRVSFRDPRVHYLVDLDLAVSKLWGAADLTPNGTAYRPHWVLIDPLMQIVGRFRLADGRAAIAAARTALAMSREAVLAPVLAVPHVLEPDFCRSLIDLYDQIGGTESGIMRQIGDKTVGVYDHRRKRRLDIEIPDESIRAKLRHRLSTRLLPMINRAFQYEATRIERYIVACYEGETGGHFAAHRDNTTSGTAHRQFAVTINLNDDYDGGDLSFPEFGPRRYRATPGGAIVFSCSMMHEVSKVTRGRRFATLPFLYNDAAATVRQANHGTVVPDAPSNGDTAPQQAA